MKISELNTGAFSGDMYFPVAKGGANYKVAGEDLRNLFVIINGRSLVLAAPLSVGNWGAEWKYLGVRVDHLMTDKIHIDFTVEVNTAFGTFTHRKTDICLVMQDGNYSLYQYGDGEIQAEALYRGDDNAVWLVMSVSGYQALATACVSNLRAYNMGDWKNEATRFDNYKLRTFAELPGIEL